jgi:hypothetical protein
MQHVTDLADPRRCQGSSPTGQCRNVAEPGCDFCRAHQGADTGEEKRIYLLHKSQYRDRLTKLSSHDNLKSLREEIAIVRMLIEEKLNLVRNEADFISSFGPIQQALLTVEKLMKTFHAMEQSLGSLLSKTAIVRLGQSISSIIIDELKEVPDFEAIVDRINSRILEAIVNMQNVDE